MHKRATIQQLPPNLVNRIAAGEVIERPASVVKELVENALDAGATRLRIEVEEGGSALIRVTDDGFGIARDELPLAFAAHATSKLRSDADLMAIASYGFRGEALASIGSVSQSKIVSRTATTDEAFELGNDGGALADIKPVAGGIGTSVEVRNLFFNVPARRKFLKTVGTEMGHISETVLKLALPRPAVAFTLTSGGREVAKLEPTDERTRWLSAWPEDMRGRSLEVRAGDEQMTVRGIVGLPELATPMARHQYLYVNGRWVRDKTISAALKEAFRGLTEPGRHPPAVLLVECDPGLVDVNVHPAKSEVRFRDTSRVFGLVMSAVREKLLGSDLTPKAVARQDYFGPSVDTTRPREERAEAPSTLVEDRISLQQRLADFFRAPPVGAQQSLPHVGVPQATVQQPPAPLPASLQPPAFKLRSAETQRQLEPPTPPPSLPSAEVSASQVPTPPPPLPAPQPFGEGPVPAIQLHNSYLVVQSNEGMQIIDQHALHERILFEDLLTRLTRGPLESQHLLMPLTFPASAMFIEAAERIAPLLAKLGIELSAFGPTSLAVQAFPTFLQRLDPVDFCREVLEKVEVAEGEVGAEELLHNVLDMMACKAAVKAGDPLQPGEISALLARRHLVDRASNCPHGRPTTLSLTLKDLEKQFKRTGF